LSSLCCGVVVTSFLGRLQVLTDLNNRGVKDILIASVDGLTGFPEAINAIFPKTDSTLYRSPDSQFPQVRGLQTPQGVRQRSQRSLSGCLERSGRNRVGASGREVGSEISHRHSILEKQVGESLQLLQISRRYPTDRLYDQHYRIGPSAVSKAHQDQRSFPQ